MFIKVLYAGIFIIIFSTISSVLNNCGNSIRVPYIPIVEGQWWRIGNNPNLDNLLLENGRSPEVVDHGFIQARNGTWQIWACIRRVKVGRIFYRWEGTSLEHPNWTPKGIALRADSSYGESIDPDERLQSPFFKVIDDKYYLFYGGGWSPHHPPGVIPSFYQICLASSDDGITYRRFRNKEGYSQLFEGPGMDRDPMVIKIGDTYYCYYSSTVDNITHGLIACRTSKDLHNWSDYTVVSEGGSAGNGPWSAECPFVLFLDMYYYLFRTSSYVPPVTYVYRSKDPLSFGINDDSKKIAVIEVAAPEIIKIDNQYYISTIADYQGICVSKLSWNREN
jgi:hypothetical protein